MACAQLAVESAPNLQGMALIISATENSARKFRPHSYIRTCINLIAHAQKVYCLVGVAAEVAAVKHSPLLGAVMSERRSKAASQLTDFAKRKHVSFER